MLLKYTLKNMDIKKNHGYVQLKNLKKKKKEKPGLWQ